MEYFLVDLDLLLHVSRDIVYPYSVGFTDTKVPWTQSSKPSNRSFLSVRPQLEERNLWKCPLLQWQHWDLMEWQTWAMGECESNVLYLTRREHVCNYITIFHWSYSVDGFHNFQPCAMNHFKNIYIYILYKEALTINDPSKTWLRIYLTILTWHEKPWSKNVPPWQLLTAASKPPMVKYCDIFINIPKISKPNPNHHLHPCPLKKKNLHQTRKWSASPPGSDHSVSGASQHLWINNDKHVTKNMEHTMQGGGSSVPVQTFTTRMMMMMVVVVMMMMVIMPTTTSYIMIRVITRLKNDQYDQDDQQEQTDQYDQKEHPSEEKSWAQHWWLFDW